jgi:soluble lytic murein transglycosylase
MVRLDEIGDTRRRRRVYLVLGVALVVVLAAAILGWTFRDYIRSPQALYQEAQTAQPERAAVLYARLAEKLPEIEEYTRLWAAQASMPNLEALRTLQAVASFRPQSPAAHQAHLALARYYASIEAPQAEDEYQAALDLHDTVALRLELALALEEQGDEEAAYAEYQRLLSEQADAFEGMRRTGQDPLAVAQDLSNAYYFTDALETLRQTGEIDALPLRAEALAGLQQYDAAQQAYVQWLRKTPDDDEARVGLARALQQLGQQSRALSLVANLDTPDAQLTTAELLEGEQPDEALALYLESPYPVAWWSASTILESQGRLTETLPVYARLARTQTYLADDAAYRLHVLAQRTGDEQAEADSERLLAGLGLNWLALRAGGEELDLFMAAPLDELGEDIVTKAQALESIGRDDLARLELILASHFRRAPEVDLVMAEALASRGYVVDAQEIAATYVVEHPQAPLDFWELAYPRPYSTTVEAAAAEFSVDPLLLWAVMREESRYDPEALSYVGARGLMQVMPTTQEWIAEQLGEEISPGEAFTPETSIRMGAWFLRFLLDYFEDDLDLAVAAYNGGAGSVDIWLEDPRVSDRDDFLRWIGFGETREYLSKVLLSYRVYRELYGDRPAEGE